MTVPGAWSNQPWWTEPPREEPPPPEPEFLLDHVTVFEYQPTGRAPQPQLLLEPIAEFDLGPDLIAGEDPDLGPEFEPWLESTGPQLPPAGLDPGFEGRCR